MKKILFFAFLIFISQSILVYSIEFKESKDEKVIINVSRSKIISDWYKNFIIEKDMTGISKLNLQICFAEMVINKLSEKKVLKLDECKSLIRDAFVHAIHLSKLCNFSIEYFYEYMYEKNEDLQDIRKVAYSDKINNY